MQAQSAVFVLVASEFPAVGTGAGARATATALARAAASACAACCCLTAVMNAYSRRNAISWRYVTSCAWGTALEKVANFATFWAWVYDIGFQLSLTARCWLTASCRVTRAEAAGLLLNNAKSNVGTTMTAAAVPSAMRIRTAPPFVGRVQAPGSARCGRAPAIAFAPRTESGKASSVLASRRRVCGRLCTAPWLVPGVVLDSVWLDGLRTGAPRPWSV